MDIKTENIDTLERIRILRNKGDYKSAITVLNQLLKERPGDNKVLVEAIRISIAQGANEEAMKLFRYLQQTPEWQQSMPREVWLRLQMSFPEQFENEDASVLSGAGASWCDVWDKDGTVPVYAAQVAGWQVRCGDGTTTYTFESQCACCAEIHSVFIHMSFLVYREYLCPQCLATQYIDYELIREKVSGGDSRPAAAEIEKLDDYLRNLRNRLNFDVFEANEFPLLCQYLNIDYAFMLNQLFLRRLYEK